MTITVKGGAQPPPIQPHDTAKSALDEALARLQKKRTKKKGAGSAADAVSDVLDEVVGGEGELESELDEARRIADEISDNLPEGSGMEQAEAIASQLKEKIEATRGRRAHLTQRIRKAFEDL